MNKDPLLNNAFLSANTVKTDLIELQEWINKGYTDIVLFGRLQPPHRGHRALLETLRSSKLNINLVLNDKTDNIEGERNPFNATQREEMIKLSMPWIPSENIRHATVYLGGGGDVGNDVRRLTNIFDDIAPKGKLVLAYYEKEEDRKEYLVDGETITNTHYVELVGQPRGKFPIQRITQNMINAASEYVDIDAKMFRNAVRQKDQVCYELLDPPVAQYVRDQLELAEQNNRLVGADQSRDTITLEQLRSDDLLNNTL